jgi:hypothetical protein
MPHQRTLQSPSRTPTLDKLNQGSLWDRIFGGIGKATDYQSEVNLATGPALAKGYGKGMSLLGGGLMEAQMMDQSFADFGAPVDSLAGRRSEMLRQGMGSAEDPITQTVGAGGSWNPRDIIARQENRPFIAKLVSEAIADPLNVVPGLGFIKYPGLAGKTIGRGGAQTTRAAMGNRLAKGNRPFGSRVDPQNETGWEDWADPAGDESLRLLRLGRRQEKLKSDIDITKSVLNSWADQQLDIEDKLVALQYPLKSRGVNFDEATHSIVGPKPSILDPYDPIQLDLKAQIDEYKTLLDDYNQKGLQRDSHLGKLREYEMELSAQ